MEIWKQATKEMAVSRLFSITWVSLVFSPIVLMFFVNIPFTSSSSDKYTLTAILVTIINIVFVFLMYFLDIKLRRTNGLLSYWDWDDLNDNPPYNTISICISFFLAVIVGTIGLEQLSPKFSQNSGQAERYVLYFVFCVAFMSVFPIIIQLNIFDGLGAQKAYAQKNRRLSRRRAWYLYVYMLYAFVFCIIGLSILFKPGFGIFTNLVFAILLSLYYFSRLPITCQIETNDNLLEKYYKLRCRLYNRSHKNDDSYQRAHFDNVATKILIMYKSKVVGGVRLIFSNDDSEHLPLERNEWKIREKLKDTKLDGSLIAEISGLVIDKPFQKRGTLDELSKMVYKTIRKMDVKYAFAVAPKAQAKIYSRLGLEKVESISYPFHSRITNTKLHLLMWNLASITNLQRLDSAFGYDIKH